VAGIRREQPRVLKWIVERLDGQAAAMPSAIGNLPTRESFDVSGWTSTIGAGSAH